LGVVAVPAALELIKDGVGEDGLVHHLQHRAGFHAESGLGVRRRGFG